VRFGPKWPFGQGLPGQGNASGDGSALYRDHGLVIKDDPKATHFYAYVGNVKDFNIRAMVLVRGYSEKAPVPSLGHDKFNHSVKSDVRVTWDEYVTTMTFKTSGSIRGQSKGNLQRQIAAPIFEYEVYRRRGLSALFR